MKTMKRNLLFLACLFVAGFSLYATSFIWKLESPLPDAPLVRSAASAPRQLTHGFDDSFREHFGQRGIDIVESAFIRGITEPDKILTELKEPRFRYDLK
jgi:hypothetical protein